MFQQYSLAIVLLICFQILFAASFSADVDGQGPTQQNSSSLYDKLCRSPSTLPKGDAFSLKSLYKAKKWHIVFGSDVARQFFGSVLKGKQLLRSDVNEYEGMCFEINTPFAKLGQVGIGTLNGFGELNPSIFNCMSNDEIPGTVKCLDYNIATKFQATVVAHFMDKEAGDYHVVVDCYSNNEVGWLALTSKTSLTDEEYVSLKKQIVDLGFDGENIVPMYDEKCSIGKVPE